MISRKTTLPLTAILAALLLGGCGGGGENAEHEAIGTWGTPELVETDNVGDAHWSYGPPLLAMDAVGNAIAVWSQWNGTQVTIRASRAMAGSIWNTPEVLSTGGAGNKQIAINAGGEAIAVWSEFGIRARRFVDGSWGMPEVITTTPSSAPKIAINAGGEAIAAWSESGIRARRFVDGSWGMPEVITATPASAPEIAFDADGNALAVWTQSDFQRTDIFAAWHAAGGWGMSELIETDDAGSAGGAQIAIDARGNAIVVWAQSDGPRPIKGAPEGVRQHIWANRYRPSSGWGTPELIETDNAGDAFAPQIAVDAAGNAIAVWFQSDGTRHNVWANRYEAGVGWGTAELIETDDTSDAGWPHGTPRIAVDARGNAVAVWGQGDGIRANIWANRYVDGTWGVPELIETDNAGPAFYPRIAVDTVGNAIAVWQQSDGTRWNIWSNRFELQGRD